MRYENLNSRSVFWICIFFIISAFFYLFSNMCFPFIVGFVLAYLCVPTIEILSKYLNRTFVSLFFALSTVLIFTFACLNFIPKLKDYLVFLSSQIPDYYSKLALFMSDMFSSINIDDYIDISSLRLEIQKYLDQRVHILASVITRIAQKGETIFAFIAFLIIMPISFFFFLKDWNHMRKYFYSCIPHQQRRMFLEISMMVRRTLANFLSGQFCVVFALSIYYSTILLMIGLENSIYLGIISGVFSFIPIIGAILSCIFVVFVSVPAMTLTKFYIIIATYYMGQSFESYFLYPKFVGKRTGLHPLWVVFSFFAGIELSGILGALIAVPSAAVIKNIIGFAINKFKSTQAYKQ